MANKIRRIPDGICQQEFEERSGRLDHLDPYHLIQNTQIGDGNAIRFRVQPTLIYAPPHTGKTEIYQKLKSYGIKCFSTEDLITEHEGVIKRPSFESAYRSVCTALWSNSIVLTDRHDVVRALLDTDFECVYVSLFNNDAFSSHKFLFLESEKTDDILQTKAMSRLRMVDCYSFVGMFPDSRVANVILTDNMLAHHVSTQDPDKSYIVFRGFKYRFRSDRYPGIFKKTFWYTRLFNFLFRPYRLQDKTRTSHVHLEAPSVIDDSFSKS